MSNTPFALQNTSSLVFGGGSGIGFASARALLIAGSAVTLAGRTKSKLENAAELLKRDVSSTGTPKVFIVTADATSEEDVKRACKTAYENGGGKLNVVVMSAGGPDPKGDVLPLFTETSLSTFENTTKLNLTATFLLIKHSAPLLRDTALALRESGVQNATTSIVVVSSLNGSRVVKYQAGYNSAKAGMDHLVRSAAGELGEWGVRVNTISPGLVQTELSTALLKDKEMIGDFIDNMPLKRLGEAEDCANLVRFLAGPESSWITGTNINVDGGHHLFRGHDFGILKKKMAKGRGQKKGEGKL